MARYFFSLVDGVRERDEVGMELDGIESARREAVRYAGELIRGEPDTLWEKGHWRVEVTDERNVLICTIITLAIDAPTPDQQAVK